MAGDHSQEIENQTALASFRLEWVGDNLGNHPWLPFPYTHENTLRNP